MKGDQYLYGDEAADTVDVSEYDGCMCGFCVIKFIVEKGGLVPVERCEHGNIDGHYAGEYIDYSHADQRRYTIWCPGAEIGGGDGQ